ncbi:hypothetical protein C8R45DRAFT_1099861 [Mycena sanguinolenta]|nr:hypothetical protein C8R45DRAFT_1099861 [Mycena sanguinolenta]
MRAAAKRKRTASEDPVDGDTDAAPADPPKKKQNVTKGSAGHGPRRVQAAMERGEESGNDLEEEPEAGDEAAADFNDDNYNGDSD